MFVKYHLLPQTNFPLQYYIHTVLVSLLLVLHLLKKKAKLFFTLKLIVTSFEASCLLLCINRDPIMQNSLFSFYFIHSNVCILYKHIALKKTLLRFVHFPPISVFAGFGFWKESGLSPNVTSQTITNDPLPKACYLALVFSSGVWLK